MSIKTRLASIALFAFLSLMLSTPAGTADDVECFDKIVDVPCPSAEPTPGCYDQMVEELREFDRPGKLLRAKDTCNNARYSARKVGPYGYKGTTPCQSHPVPTGMLCIAELDEHGYGKAVVCGHVFTCEFTANEQNVFYGGDCGLGKMTSIKFYADKYKFKTEGCKTLRVD